MTRPTLDELRLEAAWDRLRYAARPGTGPAGATCKTCRFKWTSREQANPSRHPKCRLNPNATHGDRTTIKMSSPACAKYEEAP